MNLIKKPTISEMNTSLTFRATLFSKNDKPILDVDLSSISDGNLPKLTEVKKWINRLSLIKSIIYVLLNNKLKK